MWITPAISGPRPLTKLQPDSGIAGPLHRVVIFMLKEGDIIELKEGMSVYCEVPEHFLYENRRGVFDKYAHGLITIEDHFDHLIGRYVVYKTAMDGGGTGHGVHDVYPNGHHVFAERLDDPSVKVDFYQSGCFTAMLPELKPVAKAVRRWTER